jgi:hypothetical protein
MDEGSREGNWDRLKEDGEGEMRGWKETQEWLKNGWRGERRAIAGKEGEWREMREKIENTKFSLIFFPRLRGTHLRLFNFSGITGLFPEIGRFQARGKNDRKFEKKNGPHKFYY